MTLLIPPRQYDPAIPELIENPSANVPMLRDELKSIRTINRLFGGYATIRRGVTMLLPAARDREISVLDLGTGSADLPVYLTRLGRRLGRKIRITAVDNHPLVLEVARMRTKRFPEITVEAGNLLKPNYPNESFDIVTCSLTLHHFAEEDAIRILKSMNALCRIGFIVNDLNRNRIAAWTTKLYTFLTTSNPMTRRDSYLSVLRGFTPEEIHALANDAGLQQVQVETRPFFRFLLVGKHQ